MNGVKRIMGFLQLDITESEGKEAYLDQVSEENFQENLAIVPKELFHEDQSVQNPSKLQTTRFFP